MIYVITGANRGIGLALCESLVQRGKEVVAVCRKPSPELERLKLRVESGIDVTRAEHVADLSRRLAGARIEVLINNAGVLREDSLDQLDFSALENQIAVNAVAPLRVSHALLPMLQRGSKIALITSRMGSMADNGSGAYYGYRMSKAALNAAGVSLARDLRTRGISVVLLHPGYVRTEMTSGMGSVSPTQAAEGLLARIDELTLDRSGSFFHASGEQLPW